MLCDSVCSVANPLLDGGSTLDVPNMYWLLLCTDANSVRFSSDGYYKRLLLASSQENV